MNPAHVEPAWDRDGMHSGIGGLAHLLAEIAQNPQSGLRTRRRWPRRSASD